VPARGRWPGSAFPAAAGGEHGECHRFCQIIEQKENNATSQAILDVEIKKIATQRSAL
jgi:hypothetical protein